jgi:hypothetical protein
MKLKLIVVDLEMSPRARKWCVRLGVPAVILSVAAVALASPLHVWNDGDTLLAADLNGNFSNLQGQLTTIQARGGAVVWKDANGAIVPVVASRPDTGELWVADQNGHVWIAYAMDGIAITAGGSVYWGSQNCTGTAYTSVPFPGLVFTAGDNTLRVAPPDVPGMTVSIASVPTTGASSCMNGAATLRWAVALAATVPSTPIVQPFAPLFAPPARPVFMP